MTTQRLPYRLTIHGPFDVPQVRVRGSTAARLYTIQRAPAALSEFWNMAVGDHDSEAAIGGKNGCYVFAMRLARGFTPWYVGKTDRRLDREVFTPDKIVKYNEVLLASRGNPVLFLVTSASPGKSKLPSRIVDRLESDLIQFAFEKNPDLKNERRLTDPLAYEIDGIGTRGKPSRLARAFKTMMGM